MKGAGTQSEDPVVLPVTSLVVPRDPSIPLHSAQDDRVREIVRFSIGCDISPASGRNAFALNESR